MKRNNLFWGLIIVLLGAVLLAINLGVVGSRIWPFFWPALIILVGIWFLLGYSQKHNLESIQYNLPYDDCDSAEIEIHHGAGRLEVNSISILGDLISGSFAGGVTADVNRQQKMMKVVLQTPSDAIFSGPWGAGHGLEWKVGITRELPVKLHFHTGASESIFDLTELQASDITLETGASSSEILMPAHAGNTRAKIESGVASVKIRIPDGVGANIHVESGLSGLNIDPARFSHEGEYYRSSNYATAENKIDLSIETGVGSVEIK